jgi:putative ABC transport system ATP-binding protein
MPTAIELRGVTRTFSNPGSDVIHAVQDVTLSVPIGTATAVVGRSGSGKSTLLHLCAGIDLPTSGDVQLFGQPINGMNDRDRTRLRRDTVGLVFQFFHLLPHLTVHDNVALPLLISGESSKIIKERVTALLAEVGLSDRRNETPNILSGGEQQRVAICRALVQRPKLVLADEPTGNLDDETGREIMDLLFSLTRQLGHTLMFVTHSQELAARADQIKSMNSGRLASL